MSVGGTQKTIALVTRQPAADTEGLPRCFGLEHDAGDPRCVGCPVVRRCFAACQPWSSRLSLSERLAEAMLRVDAVGAGGGSPEDTYVRLYRDHFGRAPSPRSLQTKSSRTVFRKLVTLCQDHGVDPAAYMNAQMHTMRPYLESQAKKTRKRVAFLPSFMSGGKAIRRYNLHVQAAMRRYGGSTVQTFSSCTSFGRFRNMLFLTEREVGDVYVQGVLSRRYGGSFAEDWAKAADAAGAGPVWRRLRLATAGRFAADAFYRQYGEAQVKALVRLAELHAACDVADLYKQGACHVIGFRGAFSWEAFAKLLDRAFGDRARAAKGRLRLDGVPGNLLWG